MILQPRLSRLVAKREGAPPHGGARGARRRVRLRHLRRLLRRRPGRAADGLPRASCSTSSMQRLNAVKNVLAGLVNAVAAVVFVLASEVAWDAAAVIAIGSTIGGQLGGMYGRRLPPDRAARDHRRGRHDGRRAAARHLTVRRVARNASGVASQHPQPRLGHVEHAARPAAARSGAQPRVLQHLAQRRGGRRRARPRRGPRGAGAGPAPRCRPPARAPAAPGPRAGARSAAGSSRPSCGGPCTKPAVRPWSPRAAAR